MKPTVISSIDRPNAELSTKLAEQGVSTVHEAMNRGGLMNPRIRPVNPGLTICGPAVTSLNHTGDNMMVHTALSVCQPGDVLVVSTIAPSMYGMIGELIVRQALMRGIAGIIIDSGVRDVTDIRDLQYPIWSAGFTAAGTVKETPGWVNIPMVCAGAQVNPGDLIVADDDGVVVVPQGEAEEILKAAQERTDKEAETRKGILEGEISFTKNNMETFLRSKGTEFK